MNVSFTNPGLIPLEAITTLGVNVKENDNPIGFFGTGLKYAIASLLRTNQKITIWRGYTRYDFSVFVDKVRGKDFGFIYIAEHNCESVRLGFTTNLGKTWEMWQIFRELFSNCLDEKGQMGLGKIDPREGWTTIIVEGDQFFDAALKKDEIFLSTKPLFSIPETELHEGRTQSIFYRGVKAYHLEESANFSYNILTPTSLTEDRTIKSSFDFQYWISRLLAKCPDRDILEKALTQRDTLEWNLSYWPTPSSERIDEGFARAVLGIASRRGFTAVASNALLCAEEFMKEKVELRPAIVTQFEQKQIVAALAFLRDIGFGVEQEIIITTNLGEGVFGQARNGKIYLSKRTLDQGRNFLIGTILEEHLHLEYGFQDESRDFQNFLFDLVIKFAKQSLGKEN